MTADIHPLTVADYPWVLALNQAHETETSPLDAAQLARMHRAAFCASAVESNAFLLTFDAHADYASVNYQWFCTRQTDFVYVDRIIVSPAARGRGLARLLYADLFAAAAAASMRSVVCEVNSDPPNPASDAFHASLGFQLVGTATLPGSAKTVQYLQRLL